MSPEQTPFHNPDMQKDLDANEHDLDVAPGIATDFEDWEELGEVQVPTAVDLEVIYPDTKPISFGGETFTPAPETIVADDAETKKAIKAATELVVNNVNEQILGARVTEFNVILAHGERIAAEHDGAVPIEELRSLLIDLLRGQK